MGCASGKSKTPKDDLIEESSGTVKKSDNNNNVKDVKETKLEDQSESSDKEECEEKNSRRSSESHETSSLNRTVKSGTPQCIYLSTVEFEVWVKIFDYLTIVELAKISRCCKYNIHYFRLFYKVSGDKRLFCKFTQSVTKFNCTTQHSHSDDLASRISHYNETQARANSIPDEHEGFDAK